MIRRLCFCFVLCLVLFSVARVASAQMLKGAKNFPSAYKPSVHGTEGKHTPSPLAKRFTIKDTFQFGTLPQSTNVYGTFDVKSNVSVTAVIWDLPFTKGTLQFKAMDDSGFEYPAIAPKSTTELNYSVIVEPDLYQQEFNGGPVVEDVDFEFLNEQGTGSYQSDTVWMFANPLPLDTVGPTPVVKLVHFKTESLSTGFTSNEVADLATIPEMWDTFYIQNAEKDSLQVTTGQYWGNTIFSGEVERPLPCMLAPGERIRVFTHFSPGAVPDTLMTYYMNNGQIDSSAVAYYYDEFVIGTDKALGVKFQSNATASGYKPSRITTAPPPPPEAVNESKSAIAIQVYPNPVAKTLRIAGVQGQHIELLDLLGKRVMRCTASFDKVSLDVSSLPVGSYMLRIGNEIRPITVAR